MSRSSSTGRRDPHHGRQPFNAEGKAGRRRARQYRVLLLVFLGTILLTAILHFSGGSSFEPYLGPSNPVPTAAAVILLGAAALLAVDARGEFRVQREADRRKGLFFAAGLASLCAVPPITIDLFARFPRDMNVAWPHALLFYPAIACIAEMVFHALPLAALLLLLGPIVGEGNRDGLHWAAIATVALVEPVFQTVLGRSDGLPLAATVAVASHVFVLNLLQLWVFKRFDFVSMLAFRLVFYAYWHLLWGYARLQLLF